jgi:hypothetical protein
LREPKVFINLNEPTRFEEFPEFKVKVRTHRERMKELQKTVRQLKREKTHIEQWTTHQQEIIQGFKKKKQEQRAFLKEIKEINFRLYIMVCLLQSSNRKLPKLLLLSYPKSFTMIVTIIILMFSRKYGSVYSFWPVKYKDLEMYD